MTQPTTLYKVLSANGRSCHGGDLQWPLPTQHPDGTWTPGAAVRVTGPLVPCENGIHLATAEQVVRHWLGARVWVAQWCGEVVDAGDKWVAREVRLLHGTGWTDRTARHFAADCAERVLARVKNPDPRSVAAIQAARDFAEGRIDRKALAAAAADATATAYAYAAYADAADATAYAYYAAYAAAADATAYYYYAAADRTAERRWQAVRFEYYLKGGQPGCSA